MPSSTDFKMEFDTTVLDNIYKAAKQAHTKHIRFGWLDGKKYPATHKNKGLPIAQVAQWQEYGTHNIPARPYAAISIYKTANESLEDIKDYFLAVCRGSYDVSYLNNIVARGKKTFSDTVMNQGEKSLSPTTIRIKGHDFQLDHTGYLLQNFDAKVYKTNFEKTRYD